MESSAGAIQAMLSLEPELDLRLPRKSPRLPLRSMGVMRRAGGSGVGIQILDLSVDGFQVETHLELSVGDDCWVRLPGLESRHARVMWRRHARFGCKFMEPLHPAVLASVVRNA